MRLVLFAFITLLCSALQAAEIRVSAAASLTDVLRDLGGVYEKETGGRVVFNFGASNLLARQIEEGAPADVFVSADELRMNQLIERGLVRKRDRHELVRNTLVLVVPTDSTLSLKRPADLRSVRRLALADPRSVPAGIYAKEYLTRLNLWTRIAPKVVPLDNVRAALAVVESGNADAAFVYRTDAMISPRVRVAFAVPLAQGPKIVYPVAVLAEAREPDEARRFVSFLRSPRAKAKFRRYGFIVD